MHACSSSQIRASESDLQLPRSIHPSVRSLTIEGEQSECMLYTDA